VQTYGQVLTFVAAASFNSPLKSSVKTYVSCG
jgi:hypothetical protein